MQKSGGITVAAVLLTILAVIGTLSTIGFSVVVATMPRSGATAQQAGQIIQGVLIAFFAVPAICTWFIAVGLFRGRNWARIGGVVLGCLIAVASLFFLLSTMAMMLLPQTRMQLGSVRFGLVLAGGFYLGLAAFGVWLAIYLNLQRVRQAFRPNTLYVPASVAYPPSSAYDPTASSVAPPAAATYVAVPSPATLQVSRGSSVPRIGVLTMAALSLVGSLSLLGMAMAGMPLFYLGATLHGNAARLALVVLAVLNIGIAIGLLRRFAAAYYASLALQVLGIASSLALLSPSIRARAVGSSMAFAAHMGPQLPQQQAQMQPMMHAIQNGALLLNAVLLPFVFCFFIWALWRDLTSIRRPSAPSNEDES